jgi:hypothetical protein
MRTASIRIINRFSILLLFLLFPVVSRLDAQNTQNTQNIQKISFGVFADPVISWFSTGTKATHNDGARAGFNFGFTFNKYFASNYAFSTGLSILNAGGRLVDTAAMDMKFNNMTKHVPANVPVIYKIQYLSVPIGLKFKSNQIGYITFFTDIGLDPKVVIGGKVDIPSPSVNITGEAAMNELNRFNIAYHVMAGIEYSLGGSTSLVLGLGYDNNFLDVTKDILNQPTDKITHKILKFRIGVNF